MVLHSMGAEDADFVDGIQKFWKTFFDYNCNILNHSPNLFAQNSRMAFFDTSALDFIH